VKSLNFLVRFFISTAYINKKIENALFKTYELLIFKLKNNAEARI
jgi:hypothetical protein